MQTMFKSSGQALLTGAPGYQPLPPTPGFPPEGLIVYNGSSYGAGITVTRSLRLFISGNYSHAVSDTLSNTTFQ